MHKARIKIYGMDCPSCSSSIERTVKKYAPVESIKCNYIEGTLYIEYEEYVDFSLIEEKLLHSGYRIPEDTIGITLPKEGKALKGEFLSSFEGALEWEEKNDGEIKVKVIRTGDTEGEIISFFEKHGISAALGETESGEETILAESQMNVLRNLILSILLSFPLLWGPSPYIQAVLGSLIQIFPARRFYRGAVRSIKSGKLNMDVLVSLSTSVIYIFSLYTVFTEKEDIKLYFLCQGVLVSMLLFGLYLESLIKGETTRTLKRLVSLIPRKTRVVLSDGTIEEKDISQINIKDRLTLEKGERIPLDGIVVDGGCMVDESVMTGESALVEKKKEDNLISGTVIREGSVIMEVISGREDSAIERVISIVRNAETEETPERRKADRIASVFIPSVIATALVVFFLWYFILSPHDLETAAVTAAGVLVVACPCALGLAIPTSIMVGCGRGAEMGILFKNTAVFSYLSRVDTVAVDKTGTLTSSTGKSEEEIRNGVDGFVSSMKKRGLDIILISGDTKERAEKIAEKAGIEKVVYGMKSEEKAAFLKKLKNNGRKILMIGDGVNDAPAMAISDVGISIENGTQIAKDTADIIILNDEIGKVEEIFFISEKIVRNIKENLIWALLYNSIAIPLAAVGIMNPSIASAAMSFSSIAVLLNSLKLRKMEVKR